MFCCCRFMMRCCSCLSQRRRPLLKAGSSSISFLTRTSGWTEPSPAPPLSLYDDDSPSSLLASSSSSSSCKRRTSKWAWLRWGRCVLFVYSRIPISFHIARTILPGVHTSSYCYFFYQCFFYAAFYVIICFIYIYILYVNVKSTYFMFCYVIYSLCMILLIFKHIEFTLAVSKVLQYINTLDLTWHDKTLQ